MTQVNAHPELARRIGKRIIQVSAYIAVQASVLLLAAGTLHWPLAWAYLATSVLQTIVGAAVLVRCNPEVVAERSRFTPKRQLPYCLDGSIGGSAEGLLARLCDNRFAASNLVR